MQNDLNHSESESEESEAPAGLSVLLVYEDFETGKRAQQTYDFLVHHAGAGQMLRQTMWKFDVLQVAKLREIAAEEASESDLIILSMHGESPLPGHIMDWLELWTQRRTGRTSAIAALLDCAAEHLDSPTSACGSLREFCRRRRLHFFVQLSRREEEQGASSGMCATGTDTGSHLIQHLEGDPRWVFAE